LLQLAAQKIAAIAARRTRPAVKASDSVESAALFGRLRVRSPASPTPGAWANQEGLRWGLDAGSCAFSCVADRGLSARWRRWRPPPGQGPGRPASIGSSRRAKRPLAARHSLRIDDPGVADRRSDLGGAWHLRRSTLTQARRRSRLQTSALA